MTFHVAYGALHFAMSHGLHRVLRNDLVQFLFRNADFLAVGRLVPLLTAIVADPGLMRVAALVQLAPVDPVFLLWEVGKRLERQVLHRDYILHVLEVTIGPLRAKTQ